MTGCRHKICRYPFNDRRRSSMNSLSTKNTIVRSSAGLETNQ